MTLVPATKLGVDVPVPPLATGNKPTTPVVNGNPVALVNVTEVGVPRTGVTSVGDVERTTEPEPVEVVTPVPPLATANVPANVTAPVVAVLGVNPVEPAENEVTPPVDAAHVAVVPLDVSTYPLVPMPRRVALFTPLPTIKSPTEVIGDSALNAATAVVCPVPPLAITNVPFNVIVPAVVIGPPFAVNPVVPPLTFTLVTEPEPAEDQMGLAEAPCVVSVCPDVPGDSCTHEVAFLYRMPPCVPPPTAESIKGLNEDH